MKNERLGDASLSKSPGENNESGKGTCIYFIFILAIVGK